MKQEVKCEKCHTLVEVLEVNVFMPYKTTETAECPVCGEIIYKRNSRGDFESRVISLEETLEPYKSKYLKK